MCTRIRGLRRSRILLRGCLAQAAVRRVTTRTGAGRTKTPERERAPPGGAERNRVRARGPGPGAARSKRRCSLSFALCSACFMRCEGDMSRALLEPSRGVRELYMPRRTGAVALGAIWTQYQARGACSGFSERRPAGEERCDFGRGCVGMWSQIEIAEQGSPPFWGVWVVGIACKPVLPSRRQRTYAGAHARSATDTHSRHARSI